LRPTDECLDRILKAFKWRRDIERSEMIQSRHWAKDHLSFEDPVSQKDLDLICEEVNMLFWHFGIDLRVANNAGEIVPWTA